MCSLLTPIEALDASDAFLMSIYGKELFIKWRKLKYDMSFLNEQSYVSWLIELGEKQQQAVTTTENVLEHDTDYYLKQYVNETVPNGDSDACEQQELPNAVLDSDATANKDFMAVEGTCSDQQLVAEFCEVNTGAGFPLTPSPKVDTELQGNNLSDISCEPSLKLTLTKNKEKRLKVEQNGVCTKAEENSRESIGIERPVSSECEVPSDGNSEVESPPMCPDAASALSPFPQAASGSSPCSQAGRALSPECPHATGTLAGSSCALPPVLDPLSCGGGADSGDEVNMSAYYSVLPDATRPHAHRLFSCNMCLAYTSQRKSNIISHIREVHLKVKPLACTYCDYQCSRRGHLKDHLILKHGYLSEFICARCYKPFATRTKQERHQKTCVGDRREALSTKRKSGTKSKAKRKAAV